MERCESPGERQEALLGREKYYSIMTILFFENFMEPVNWENVKLEIPEMVQMSRKKLVREMSEEQRKRFPEEMLNRIISMNATCGKKNFSIADFSLYLHSYWM